MAIITISRQIASYGDEIAMELSHLSGYDFVDRKSLEADLIARGVSEESLKKYDERKPGFWASLSRNRDQYFDYLREAVYEHAQKGNTIFIGRGVFSLLHDVPGCYGVRLIAPDEVRIERLMKEFDWPEKRARALMEESDNNREGFHKCFFDADYEDPSTNHITINTGFITPRIGAEIVKKACDSTITAEEDKAGIKIISNLLLGQTIVNRIAFELNLQIYFLDAEVSSEEIILHGVADSGLLIEKAVSFAAELSEGRKVSSTISMVNEYKPYP